MILILLCVALGFRERIDLKTRGMQWGDHFLQSLDTPYHNLSFLADSGQYSLFANGLWLFSSPDPQSTEPAAHLPLLEHTDPKNILVIGDYSPELVAEIFKHPDVVRVDCVQPDPGLGAFEDAILPPSITSVTKDPRFHRFYMDPKQYLKTASHRYDVVILSAGEPVNAEMNRFFTVEFFSGIKNSLLNADGLLSFRVACSPDIIGPREALLLKSLAMTLGQVFETFLVLPGEGACFIASKGSDVLTKDPLVIIDRLTSRKLDLRYVRNFYIFDCFNPMRLAYFESVLNSESPAKVNSDLEPVCYLYGLGLWSAQIHPVLGRFLKLMAGEWERWILAGFGMLFLACLVLIRAKGGQGAAVVFSTGVCGAIVIVFEIALILLYQIIEGSVYKQLALIISFFMAGLAGGCALEGKIPWSGYAKMGLFTVVNEGPAGSPLLGRGGERMGRVFAIQTSLAVYAGVLFVIFSPSAVSVLQDASRVTAVFFLFLAFVGGMLGGAQFSAAVAVRGGTGGAALYAADLTGAAMGAVAGSLFLPPDVGDFQNVSRPDAERSCGIAWPFR